jgi:hypothetical protein
VKLIQVAGNQAESTERKNEMLRIGEREGENGDTERKRRGFKRRSALVDFDRWSKSTQKYFWILQIAISTQRYFDTR